MLPVDMENEELAALRATLLAAQRQPLAVKVAQARLSALLADGDDLLPYVLSRSCSDPRDRTLNVKRSPSSGSWKAARTCRGSANCAGCRPMSRCRRAPAAAFLAVLIVLCLVSQMLGMVLVHLREPPRSTRRSRLRADADFGQDPVADGLTELELDVLAAAATG